MGFLSSFDKFGKGLKRGFEDFAVKTRKAFQPKNIVKGLKTAGKFIEQKVLPVAQQVAEGISKAGKYAAPVLLASGIGAEFAPLAYAVGAGAGAAAKGIQTGRKLLKVAGEGVDAFSGNKPDLEKQKKFGRTVAGGALDIGAEFVPAGFGSVGRQGVKQVFGI